MTSLLFVAALTLSFPENPKAPKRRITEEEAVRNVREDPSMDNIAGFLGFMRGAARNAPDSENHRKLLTTALEIQQLPSRLGDFIAESRDGFQPIQHDYMFRSYESARFTILVEDLPSLPTPESVAVIANFLTDEEDGPKEPAYPVPQSNCDLAINGLRKMGLRGFPDTGRTMRWDENHMESLEMWRSWWSKVESGKLAFSFEGENVEYRFKPDGTWIEGPLGTTRPGDQATHSRSGELRSEKRGIGDVELAEESSMDSPARSNRFLWGAAILLALLGSGVYVLKFRRPQV